MGRYNLVRVRRGRGKVCRQQEEGHPRPQQHTREPRFEVDWSQDKVISPKKFEQWGLYERSDSSLSNEVW